MKIAFVTTGNARSILSWSGLNYYISKSLENSGNTINYIGDLKKPFNSLDFVKSLFYKAILNQKFPVERTIKTAQNLSNSVAKRLLDVDHDCILSPGTLPIAYLNTIVPKIIYTDATFSSMLNYYEAFEHLSDEIIKAGHHVEKEALDSCALAIYSSQWAARSAVHDYKIDPSKVKVVPFGANWDTCYSSEEILGFVLQRDRYKLKILFNGVDWERKGGPMVLATIDEIKKRGVNVELNVVGGITLSANRVSNSVIYHGYLNKNIPAQKLKLENLYKTSHFLFLPSQAEAFGCVISEACLFGVPSFSRKTGGLTSAVIDGKNGFALDPHANANDYADLFCEYFNNYNKYISLALSSHEDYQERLNWKVTGKLLSRLIEEVNK